MATVEEFHLMNLDQRLLKVVSDLGWSKPTDVQQAVVPLIFQGKSIIVQAKTGSGKTASFAIPILHELLQRKQWRSEQSTTVLVLTPSKELCIQVCKVFRSLSKYTMGNISFVDVSQYTDTDVMRPLLAEHPDIVIGTPARVLAHLRCGHLSLANLEHLVVDEADLLFTFGYQSDIYEFKNFFPKQPMQVVLLSATLDDTTKVLRRALVKGGDWVRVELPEESFIPSESQLTQYVISAEEDDKYTILIALLKLKLIRGKTLIFTNSVDRCFKLRLFLEEFGIRAALLNSELPVTSRCHAIDQFNRGVYDLLLATDECQVGQSSQKDSSKKWRRRDTEYGVSRGIDFQLVSNVVNFDFPLSPELYVHRVGRTARAGQLGTALSFVNNNERKLLTCVEAFLNPTGVASSTKSTKMENQGSSIFRPYQFRLSEVDGFRYRAVDVVRHITRKVVREARLKEIKLELLNSQRLKGYFEDHTPDLEALRHDKPLSRIVQPHLRDVPEYLVPAPLKALMPSGRRVRNRTKKNKSGQYLEKNPASVVSLGQAVRAKHQLTKKRKSQNPLFSFGTKKRKKQNRKTK